jgi:hypothetical protein
MIGHNNHSIRYYIEQCKHARLVCKKSSRSCMVSPRAQVCLAITFEIYMTPSQCLAAHNSKPIELFLWRTTAWTKFYIAQSCAGQDAHHLVNSLLIGSSLPEKPIRTIRGKQLNMEGATCFHRPSEFKFGLHTTDRSSQAR